MRKLGDRLRVEAMSLYRYFPSKDALLAGVVETVLANVVPPDPADPDWRGQVMANARSIRGALAGHPRMASLIQRIGPRLPKLSAVWNASYLVWEHAGADRYTATQLQLAVSAYAIGAPLWEAALSGGDEFGGDQAEDGVDETAAAIVKNAERLRRELAFEFGLGLLLDGVESELRRSRRREEAA